LRFREDINGLRALAVMAVVLFHFNSEWLPGGFSGVDVFFVVSGFLMTTIIFKGLNNNSFSVIRFYMNRANRIIPPLAALCITLLVLGWFFLTPADYRNLGINAAASSIFISNVIYWLESGYFAPGIDNNLLLHTWSLSVEWQFYLIYPILLIIANKFLSTDNIKRLLVLITLVGFSYSIYSSLYSPDSSYYLLTSRFWEMSIGGLAYLYPICFKNKKTVESIGLSLVILSFFIVSKSDLWPGYMSLIPVMGTYLVLISNGGKSFITTNRLSLFIGKISFSIYLWHWPIHVFLYKKEYENIYITVFSILASIILGYISYYFFEKTRPQFNRITVFNVIRFKPLLLSMLVFISSVTIYKYNGMLNYVYLVTPQASSYINKYKDYINRNDVKLKYGSQYIEDRYSNRITTTLNEGVFLWGDSHAEALVYGFENIFREHGLKFQAVTSSGCIAGIGIGRNDIKQGTKRYYRCKESNEYSLSFIQRKKLSIVIFVQAREHDLNDFNLIRKTIADNNIKYIIIGPVPQWRGTLPSRIAYSSLSKSDVYIDGIRPWLMPLDEKMQEKYNGSEISYISLLTSLCTDDNTCLAKVDDKNSALVWDYGHLSLEGSDYIVKHIIFPEIKFLL